MFLYHTYTMLDTKTRKKHQTIWTWISVLAILSMVAFLVLPVLTTL
ncbi:MAG: hypothetical protein HYT22_02050 [Candidatus Niyogibacteria bacterium]|nr:hypothetical protein [Candidatus Niyogibacteria bacterium]